MNSKVFRQRPKDCLTLAAECPDLYAQEALLELAAEFERMSQQLDADARDIDPARPKQRAGAALHHHRQQPRPR